MIRLFMKLGLIKSRKIAINMLNHKNNFKQEKNMFAFIYVITTGDFSSLKALRKTSDYNLETC